MVGEIIATLAMTCCCFVFAEVDAEDVRDPADRSGGAVPGAPRSSALGRLVGPLATGLDRSWRTWSCPARACPQGPFITEQELRALAEVASEEEQIEEGEKELIHSIFEFGDTIVREVMVPRPDITAIEADKTLRDVQALVLAARLLADPRLRG